MKHTPQCRELLGSISEYVDGSLQEELCRKLEQHLAECEDCQVVVNTFKKTIELYHTETLQTVPSEVRQRLYKRLDLEDLLNGTQ